MEEDNKAPVIIGSIVIVLLLVGGAYLLLKNNFNTTIPATGSSNNSVINNPTVSSGSSPNNTSGSGMMNGNGMMKGYKDGIYSSSGSYYAPSGYETIAVQLSVSNGVISSVSITPDSNDFQSYRYQERFISGANSLVVGKTLDQAYLYGRVNGASLTGAGFNNALDQIIKQAQM